MLARFVQYHFLWRSAQAIYAVSMIFMLFPLRGLADEHASGIEVPWEPEELLVGTPIHLNKRLQSPTLLKSFAQSGIQFYRRRIEPQSTNRCPFHISCSHFAEKAIERFGFIRGIAIFMDRHFFREHAGALQAYPMRETWRNNRIKLKLDDSFFLSDKRDKIGK
ncbi:MAG: membrane protein insertion efficiency factor YidD [Gemmatimonadota bacterium]|nr:membrane protein insertion efficiency factor YidD [Gemmatimonadota bacterium]MDE2832055.1 membrane protein insertion efficiency factor YidD [Gemmatimonadota bacterium]MDE2953177.1 membrane protein insertion efficiency factor YidD [Gemmatimonadota bacterium]